MNQFWDLIKMVVDQHDVYGDDGYIEIVAHGVAYRPVIRDHDVVWVSWEPYRIIGHFSNLTDPDATVTWIPHSPAPKE